ncbi:asparagine synthetase B [Marivirga tractuosa]|uniref:asparagine synthase (glutamine-hydrolyzing) n=1 Tax=Marivirga tractuosa (strain ATCC 23168 / DSM 4126 / NBRC 15989 / NCIMB 1408 / VKM B-1430 / H-43) TaxID=643867 RepID=E4TU33_MARTH|nr:asparagine synthase (glutamine-hydrolyzing) [Marivirga tractuosa]ADR23055.1 asparagine synthase (glutamine-hydrolyzing) [Marivirga tractuosa DSM 4126]BDD16271.1 asparagine synthetase B [Marivirga tractuosa]
MCGIAGVWSKNGALEKDKFDSALNLMLHRGPDESHSIKTARANLGTQRLKIIGLESGQQPLSDNLGHYLAFNGAIYNYAEISNSIDFNSQSDTEILFQLILKAGVQGALESLRGMFAFAFYDEKEDSVLLARDRMGQKPLYYYQDENYLLFASELKSLKRLMELIDIKAIINKNAIFHYLCFSNIPEPSTIYKNVFALPPAHYLKYKNGKAITEAYWQHQYLPKENISFDQAKKKTQLAIEDSVRIRLRADVKKGLFLSGGWDSSVIAYEASKHEQNLQAFTVEYPFQTTQNESKIAKETANQFGLNHQMIKIDKSPLSILEKSIRTFDQPLADSSALPNLAIAEAASQHVKVMLNGDGGDELFGGYRRYFTAKNIHYLAFTKYLQSLLPIGKRRSKLGFLNRISRISALPASERYLLYTTDMFQDADISSFWNDPNEAKTSSLDLLKKHFKHEISSLDQLMNWDRNFNLLSGILAKMDRASMAYSIESRSPFLDHQLFEITNQLPDSFRISGFSRKHLLKSIYSNKLPSSVTQATKTSFEAPLDNWLKHDFKELLKDLLYNPQAKIYNYINYTEIMMLMKGVKYQERNTDYMIYALLVLEMWLQEHN